MLVLFMLALSKVSSVYLNSTACSQGFFVRFHYQAEDIFSINRYVGNEGFIEHVFYSYNPIFKARFNNFNIPTDKTERSKYLFYDAGNIYYTCNTTSNQTLIEQGFYDYREDCYLYPKKFFHIFN